MPAGSEDVRDSCVTSKVHAMRYAGEMGVGSHIFSKHSTSDLAYYLGMDNHSYSFEAYITGQVQYSYPFTEYVCRYIIKGVQNCTLYRVCVIN